MLEGGRWQVGKSQISPVQLGPALWAGGLCWERFGLKVSEVVLWYNTSCGRNLLLVWLKDLVSELVINHSCWRSAVPGQNLSCTAQHRWQGLSDGNWEPQAGNRGRAVIPQLCHLLTCPRVLFMLVCWAFVFQNFSCLAACDVLNTTYMKVEE